MVSAERVLHGPAVPPFRVDWAFRGPADGLERMWLPWADWADWRAWVEDDDARMPTLPGYSAPLLNLSLYLFREVLLALASVSLSWDLHPYPFPATVAYLTSSIKKLREAE
eukprot:CAMPEP_0202777548 /NCGR_PEP_ID=MMETSP1388-20130828/52903_1 /ASSEMBLY_ACC=CAM_ASM_000864 /TAXON_ID=37098 /ORGANISM="Isochrysis sp, Strain CCMP1244" /LENGTH=110 /DNA_ID=CAMNT_0049446785 /DNA_START=59 /DNA_END=389 /DNA_ORIENTATION=+